MSRAGGHYKLASKNDLTQRQREVIDLIVRGKTNGEIAETLGITLDGAKWHVSEILTRLGVNSREEAADWYRAQGRRFSRPSLRSMLPVSLVKAGAGVGAAAVAGVVSFAMFTGGDAPDTEAPEGETCDPSTFETVHRQSPHSSGSVFIELQVTSPQDCVLDSGLLVRVREYPPGPSQNLDDAAFARSMTLVSEPLRAGEPFSYLARWSNWCEALAPGSRPILDMVLVGTGPDGTSVRTSGFDMAVGVAPECLGAGSPTELSVTTEDEYSFRTTAETPCYASEVAPMLIQQKRTDGSIAFDLTVSGTRECELAGQLYGRVGDESVMDGWVVASPSGPFSTEIEHSPQQLASGLWRDWCFQEFDAWATVTLMLGAGRGAVQVAQPVPERPPCPAGTSSNQIFNVVFTLTLEVEPEFRLPVDCTASPGCSLASDLFLRGTLPVLDDMFGPPFERFRITGEQGFPVQVTASEFEAAVREMLSFDASAIVAIGCSDKNGPGTCLAMDLVVALPNGSAFGLAFDNSSGAPVLFGLTPEIERDGLAERRSAIFGSANYVVLDPPIPMFFRYPDE